MVFNKNSAMAKVWAQEVIKGNYTLEQVPNIGNLREIVLGLLAG